MEPKKTMYVRRIGVKVCWTVMDGSGRFYVGEPEEATEDELAACEAGGAELPLSDSVLFLAH